MIKNKNYIHNKSLYDKSAYGRMINGQAVDYVAGMKYGICRMSFNGCEVIAVHNALVHLGRPVPIYDVAVYMERFRVLAGFFGCNAYRIGTALEHFGISYSKSDNMDSDIFIVSFWTGRKFLSSIHTVFCLRKNNHTIVYNRYNNFPDIKIYNNNSDIIIQNKIIAVYNIKGA